jgi:hypothetical protein
MCICLWKNCPEGLRDTGMYVTSPKGSDRKSNDTSRNYEGFFSYFFLKEILKAGSHSVTSFKHKQQQELRTTATLKCQVNIKWQAQIFGFILKLGFSTTLFVASKDNGLSVSEPDPWDPGLSLPCHNQMEFTRQTQLVSPLVWKQAISPLLVHCCRNICLLKLKTSGIWNLELADQVQSSVIRDVLSGFYLVGKQ